MTGFPLQGPLAGDMSRPEPRLPFQQPLQLDGDASHLERHRWGGRGKPGYPA